MTVDDGHERATATWTPTAQPLTTSSTVDGSLSRRPDRRRCWTRTSLSSPSASNWAPMLMPSPQTRVEIAGWSRPSSSQTVTTNLEFARRLFAVAYSTGREGRPCNLRIGTAPHATLQVIPRSGSVRSASLDPTHGGAEHEKTCDVDGGRAGFDSRWTEGSYAGRPGDSAARRR
jgi:hypothetical protein